MRCAICFHEVSERDTQEVRFTAEPFDKTMQSEKVIFPNFDGTIIACGSCSTKVNDGELAATPITIYAASLRLRSR